MTFYKTSNSDYGWKPNLMNKTLSVKVTKTKEKTKTKTIEAIFRTSNNSYGKGIENKKQNKLSLALSSLIKSKQRKPFQVSELYGERNCNCNEKELEESKNNCLTEGFYLNLKNYKTKSKKQNPLLTTTSNEIGLLDINPKVDGPGKIFPLSNKFSSSFTNTFTSSSMN